MNIIEHEQTEISLESLNEGDEVDLISQIKLLWENRKIVFLFVVVGILGALIYSTILPKEYKVKSTFLLPQSEAGGAGLGALQGYAEMLGVGTPANLDAYILSIIKSKRIQLMISDQFQDTFSAEIQEKKMKSSTPFSEHQALTFISKKLLGLEKNISIYKDKNNLFLLSYSYKDPEIAYRVVQKYLVALRFLNQDLGIVAKKKIIIVLDKAQIPLDHYKPRRMFNLAIGIGGMGFLSVFFILLLDRLSLLKEK